MPQERINFKILLFLILMISPISSIKSSNFHYLLTFILSFSISALSYKLKFLSLNGTFAMFLLALVIFGLGGIAWTIPILVFFIFSSILSKIKRRNLKSDGSYHKEYLPRNHRQVFANGGFGGILVILNYFFPSELFYIVFVSSIAAVCADTWSTEIGTIINSKTVNILSFKIVQQGISGGISLAGTFAGILGSAIIASCSILFINMKHTYYIFFIIFAGIVGNTFDSILGASVQAKYKCALCSEMIEKPFHCRQSASLIKGFKWIDNDMVNFATAVIGGLFGFLFIEIF